MFFTVDFDDFRKDIFEYLDKVISENEVIHLNNCLGKGVVILSEEEYSSITETLHLLGSKKNSDRIYESIQQMNAGKTN